MSFGSYLSYVNQKSDYSPLIKAVPEAANIQANAATNSGNIATGYYNQGMNSIQQGVNTSAGYNQPYVNAGQQGINQAADLSGASGKSAAEVLAQLQTNPAYRFNLDETLSAIDRSAASKGKLYSGQTMKAISDRASNLASNEYNNAFSRAMQLGQTGQNSAINQAGTAYSGGTATAGMQAQVGDIQGNAHLASQNALARGMVDKAGLESMQSTAAGIGAGQTLSSGLFGNSQGGTFYGGDLGGTEMDNGKSYEEWKAGEAAKAASRAGQPNGGGGGGGSGSSGGSSTAPLRPDSGSWLDGTNGGITPPAGSQMGGAANEAGSQLGSLFSSSGTSGDMAPSGSSALGAYLNQGSQKQPSAGAKIVGQTQNPSKNTLTIRYSDGTTIVRPLKGATGAASKMAKAATSMLKTPAFTTGPTQFRSRF